MRNISKLVIAAACFFAALTMSNVSNAQLKDTTRQKNKQTIDLSKMPATMTGGVFFYNKDNMIKATD